MMDRPSEDLAAAWNRLKVDLCSTEWLNCPQDQQLNVWKRFNNWAESELFSKPDVVRKEPGQIIVMDVAKSLDQLLRSLQVNSDLDLEQRRVALLICTELPGLDLALMKNGLDLPKVTKLIWKGITKVLSFHHKSLGAEISVKTFLDPLCARLTDGVKTLESALSGKVVGGRSAEASSGIINLTLDYFYHIGVQLNTALGMPNIESLNSIIEVLCEAMAKCQALVQTGPLSQKVEITIERIFKAFASSSPPLSQVHIGKNIFAHLCNKQQYKLAVQSLQVAVGIDLAVGLALASSMLESLATHGFTGVTLNALWSDGLTKEFASILSRLLALQQTADAPVDPSLLRAIIRCLTSPLPTASLWFKRVCQNLPSIAPLILRVAFLACCVLEEAELFDPSADKSYRSAEPEVEGLCASIEALPIDPNHFQQLRHFLPCNSALQCLLKGSHPSKYTIEDLAVARILTHVHFKGFPKEVSQSQDIITKCLLELSEQPVQGETKTTLERASVCLIRSAHCFARSQVAAAELVRFLSTVLCRGSPKLICEIFHLFARNTTLLESLSVNDLGLLVAEQLRALQMYGSEEVLLIRSCHLLQQIGRQPSATKLELNVLQSLFTTLFVHQLVASKHVFQYMVFRTYERFISTNSTDLTSTFDFLETSTTEAFLKYLQQRKNSKSVGAVHAHESVQLNGEEIKATRLEQLKNMATEMGRLKLPSLKPTTDLGAGLGEAKQLLTVLRDQIKTVGIDSQRRQVVRDEAQELTRMLQEINSILA